MNLLEPGGLRAGDVLTRRYLLMEQIGRGGMSVVWRGFDQSLQRMVAIKILEADLGADRELIRREARATARLIHPDTIEVYDYGETVTSHGRLAAYVVMRLLEGRPLADRIVQGPLPWPEAVAIAGRLATVLAAAHERGVVHRDVTAENVLLASDGAKLLDFGIAAFIGEEDDDRTGEYGTPPYVAPERLTGRVADPASDVYALGVLLFEMLTGATPYPERTWEEIENARREGPPPELRVPGLPSEVAALCRRCLAHDPGSRPRAQEVAEGLAAARARRRRSGGSARRSIVHRTAAVTALTMVTGFLVWGQVGGERNGAVISLGPAPQPSPALTEDPAPVPSSAEPEGGAGTAGPPTGGPTGGPDAGRETGAGGLDAGREREQETDTGRRTGTGGPDAGREAADTGGSGEPSAEPTVLLVENVRTEQLTLDQRVRRFNTLLAESAGRGEIRPDVALDLRQVLANSVCCAQDLTPVRQKIADRHREGSLTGRLRESLDAQLKAMAVLLAG
ncbi:serine/threonine protein kinase-like protein [Planomonospora sphaerica]|uniref:non-specific serine/threonine protein kinase n=1 Tax=Planomonospora sphaerica TaxID=161355 RepID=A0A161LIZ3_9ACTN|nr:serine/threonine-protein kinase [Planomonospora sphaerica]GAT66295.1 serine/threonine protein kinase-like protein [Planomonospora sphaerica]